MSAKGKKDNEGLSTKTPVTTIGQASEIAQAKWDAGLASGDIEVRFIDNPAAVSYKDSTWSFPPNTGKYVRFMPAWYTSDEEANKRPNTDWTLFSADIDDFN